MTAHRPVRNGTIDQTLASRECIAGQPTLRARMSMIRTAGALAGKVDRREGRGIVSAPMPARAPAVRARPHDSIIASRGGLVIRTLRAIYVESGLPDVFKRFQS